MFGRSPRRPSRRAGARLGVWAAIGAWLRIWTPPKGVEVPAIPVRSLVLAGLALSILGAAATVGACARIDAIKRRAAAEERRAGAARVAAARRHTRFEQVARRGQAVKPSAAALASRRGKWRARRSLLRQLEAAIGADARARIRMGALKGRAVRRTRCSPHPATAERIRAEAEMSLRRAAYSCVAITAGIPGVVALGHPFRAVVDFGDFSYVWCKVNPVPGERVAPNPSTLVALAEACTG